MSSSVMPSIYAFFGNASRSIENPREWLCEVRSHSHRPGFKQKTLLHIHLSPIPARAYRLRTFSQMAQNESIRMQ